MISIGIMYVHSLEELEDEQFEFDEIEDQPCVDEAKGNGVDLKALIKKPKPDTKAEKCFLKCFSLKRGYVSCLFKFDFLFCFCLFLENFMERRSLLNVAFLVSSFRQHSESFK